MFYQLLEEQTSHSYTLVEDVKVTPELAKIIANLWRDKGLQAAFRYNLFWIMHQKYLPIWVRYPKEKTYILLLGPK